MRTASARERTGKPIGGFHALHEHFHFIAGFDGELAVLGKLGRVNDAFGLVAKVDDDSAFA